MSHHAYLIQNTLTEVFEKIASKTKDDISTIQIVIYYKQEKQLFAIYRNGKRDKDFESVDLKDYCGLFSWGLIDLLSPFIRDACFRFALELGCKVDDIVVVMRHRKDAMPDTELLMRWSKVRSINIPQEFLAEANAEALEQ